MKYSDFEDWHDDWHHRGWHRHRNHHHRHGIGFGIVPLLLFFGGMMIIRHWFVAGIVLFSIAVAKTLRWMGGHGGAREKERAFSRDRDRDDGRDRDGPRSNGTTTTHYWGITPSAQIELDAILAYAEALEKAGSGGALTKELRERAQKLARSSADATLALRELRAQLPPLKAAERDTFEARLRREVDFINAADREINSTSPEL